MRTWLTQNLAATGSRVLITNPTDGALGTLKAGSRVNLEIDLIARYVERMVTAPAEAR